MKFINPISIFELMLDNPDWLDWEPETIWRDIDDKYSDLPQGEPKFSEQFKNMIMAIKLCLSNNMPWEQWEVFSHIVVSFNNGIPMFNSYVKPSLAQIAFAVHCMNKIKEDRFGYEVQGFVASIAKEEGMLVLPPILLFAKDKLDLLNSKVKDKVKVAKAYCDIFNVTKKLPDSANDDNYIAVQCAKLMAIDKYVDSKNSTRKEGNIIKVGNVFSGVGENIINVGASIGLGLHQYSLSEKQYDEIAKYIGLSDRDLAIKSTRDGIILSQHDIKFKFMSDDEIAKNIKEITGKTPEKIGAIYRRLYKASSSRLNRAINKVSHGASITLDLNMIILEECMEIRFSTSVTFICQETSRGFSIGAVGSFKLTI
jgi:hypothetical protein